MKKAEQMKINETVIENMNALDKEIRDYGLLNWKPLRSCSAQVATFGRWHVLKSYNTIVAAIDTRTDTCYDFLRYAYGYTPTSAKHISIFRRDYGAGKWGCTNGLRYYDI